MKGRYLNIGAALDGVAHEIPLAAFRKIHREEDDDSSSRINEWIADLCGWIVDFKPRHVESFCKEPSWSFVRDPSRSIHDSGPKFVSF